MSEKMSNDSVCAIYARVSTNKQEDSILNQVTLLKEVTKIRNLGIVPNEFVYEDSGISASKFSLWDRPAMKQLLNDAEQGKFSTVLFKGISRLSRDTQEALEILDRLKSKNLRVISYEENYDSIKENSNFMFTMHAAIAQYESEKLAIRVKLGRKEMAKLGKVTGAMPLGYKIEDGKVVVVEEEAKTIKEIFRLYVYEGLGMHLISIKLTELGMLPRSGTWYPGSLSKILKNEIYTGTMVYNKTSVEVVREFDGKKGKSRKKKVIRDNDKEEWVVIENNHEAIISKSDFLKAQRLIKEKTTSYTNNKGVLNKFAAKYPLTGVLICGKCGYNMFCTETKTKGKRQGKDIEYIYRKYRCSTRHRIGVDNCNQEAVKAEVLEDEVFKRLTAILEQYRKQATDELNEVTSDNSIEQELKKVEKKIEKVNADTADLYFERDNMTKEQYDYLVKTLKKKMEMLTLERDELALQLAEIGDGQYQFREIQQYIDEFFSLDRSEHRKLRRLVHYFIDKIVINDNDLDIFYKIKL